MIDETERNKREKAIQDALSINSIEGVEPSDYAKELFAQYIDGKITSEQIIKLLIERYKNQQNPIK